MYGTIEAFHAKLASGSIDIDERASQAPPSEGERSFVVVLPDGGLIQGLVMSEQGAPMGDMTVVAVPERARFRDSLERFELFIQDPQHVTSTTGPDGTFSLRVDPAASYVIVAGGNGLVQRKEVVGVRSGVSDLVVHVGYGFVLPIRFVDATGTALPRTGGFRGNTGLSYAERDPTAIPADFPRASAFLAGLPGAFDWSPKASANAINLYYYSPTPAPAIGPVAVEGEIPGFRLVSRSLVAQPISPQVVPVSVVLTANADGFGSLAIETPDWVPGDELKTVALLPPYEIHLTDESNRTASFPLTEWNGNRCVVEHVPIGSYRWRFYSYPCPWRGGDEPGRQGLVTVTKGNSASVSVDLRALSTMQFAAVKPDGKPYCGALSVRISRPLAEHSGVPGHDRPVLGMRNPEQVLFRGPPYRISALVPQEYALLVEGLAKEGFISVSLQPATELIVDLVVP